MHPFIQSAYEWLIGLPTREWVPSLTDPEYVGLVIILAILAPMVITFWAKLLFRLSIVVLILGIAGGCLLLALHFGMEFLATPKE